MEIKDYVYLVVLLSGVGITVFAISKMIIYIEKWMDEILAELKKENNKK